MYRLLCDIDKEEPSAMMEVKPDKVELCLVVFDMTSTPKITLLQIIFF